MQTPSAPPPGWYPDPHDPQAWRWWDGRQWTAFVSKAATPVKPSWSPQASSAPSLTLSSPIRLSVEPMTPKQARSLIRWFAFPAALLATLVFIGGLVEVVAGTAVSGGVAIGAGVLLGVLLVLPYFLTANYAKRSARANVEISSSGMVSDVPEKQLHFQVPWNRMRVIRDERQNGYWVIGRPSGGRLRKAFLLPDAAFSDLDRARFVAVVSSNSAWQNRWRSYIPI